MANTLENMHLIFDGNRGQYIPQTFKEQCNPQNTYWVWNYEEYANDLSDPENEFYWETWETVLNTAYWLNPETSEKYFLHHDGDLWMIRDGYYLNDEGECVKNDEGE